MIIYNDQTLSFEEFVEKCDSFLTFGHFSWKYSKLAII